MIFNSLKSENLYRKYPYCHCLVFTSANVVSERNENSIHYVQHEGFFGEQFPIPFLCFYTRLESFHIHS